LNKVLDNFTIDEAFMRALHGNRPYPHQLETARNLTEGRSVVLRAPCGSGKTEACYVSLLLGRNSLPNRLIYSLPTRALVEEIAERINKGIGKIGLLYSVSPQHGANSKDPFFKSDVIVATIDQTIGAYCCTPLSLPAYLGNIPAGAAVSAFHCFDEAHIYDRFLGLQSMLVLIERAKALGVPFLVMSATLPDSFVGWFQNKLGKEYVKVVEGCDDDVQSRRNRNVILNWRSKFLEARDIFYSSKSFRRIMVVCNTVDRAQMLYRQVFVPLQKQGFKIFLLHSRFLDEDRKNIEKNMRMSLEDKEGKTCLVTTQVCEVGLDISCDLLLTELAPPDSLVQRIGRCARKGGNGEVWVFDVEHFAPYEKNEMVKSRDYISQELESKRIGWSEELKFVNSLLNEDFELIMNDENRRRSILKSLGDAAFKGSKKDVEKNIQEILNANITIYDNPSDLDLNKLLHMPWIDVDVRVLRRHLLGKARFWQVDFEHDENGEPDFHVTIVDDIFPYEYYIVHPNFVRYTSDCGLFFGEKGECLNPIDVPSKPRRTSEYQTEPWTDHVRNCLDAFEQLKNKEIQTLKLLDTLIGKHDLTKTEGIVALSIATHDLGKLSTDWQKSIGVKTTDTPLAHTPIRFKGQLPPHATVSAYAMSQMINCLLGNADCALAFELAIGHHHHTRAEHVPKYTLGWQRLYNGTIKEISEKFSLNMNGNIEEKIESPTKLDTPFFDFERKKQYTIYCIVARFIRLSDQASFGLNRQIS
jgi:CRISPR-associated endonuclease/helicase Cas3